MKTMTNLSNLESENKMKVKEIEKFSSKDSLLNRKISEKNQILSKLQEDNLIKSETISQLNNELQLNNEQVVNFRKIIFRLRNQIGNT